MLPSLQCSSLITLVQRAAGCFEQSTLDMFDVALANTDAQPVPDGWGHEPPGGHTETKSPPGPNLHTGSNDFVFFSIIVTTSLLMFAVIAAHHLAHPRYRQAGCKNPNKNRTKIASADVFQKPVFIRIVKANNIGRVHAPEGTIALSGKTSPKGRKADGRILQRTICSIARLNT